MTKKQYINFVEYEQSYQLFVFRNFTRKLLGNNRIDFDDIEKIAEENYKRWVNKKFYIGEIIFETFNDIDFIEYLFDGKDLKMIVYPDKICDKCGSKL